MTVKQAIDSIDALKPNAFSTDQKTAWLNVCEGKLQNEVLLWDPAEVVQYGYTADKSKEMLLDPPYDHLYVDYLAARIDLANGEYEKYANSQAFFSAGWQDFVRWFTAKYRPADRPGLYYGED